MTTDSPVTTALVKQWVNNCCHNHVICGPHPETTKADAVFTPTRLIAVGAVGEADVKLVEKPYFQHRDGKRCQIRYVALSHRWGEHTKRLLLTVDTFADMHRSIPLARLSQTFRDAIKTTRSIGVPYLWIDSLCIAQGPDGQSEFETEAQTMGKLYAAAVCVISATAPTVDDAFGGYFSRRRTIPQQPVAVLVCRLTDTRSCLVARPGTLNVFEAPETEQPEEPGHAASESVPVESRDGVPFSAAHADDADNTSLTTLFRQYVEDAPISRRGWTFQERILAQRTVHFCDGLVLFECNTMRASEYHPRGVPYPQKAGLRRDGTLWDPDDFARLHEDDPPTVRVPRTYDNFYRGVPTGQYTVHEFVRNPAYRTRREKRTLFFQLAALAGMRGDFQVLLEATLDTLQQKAQFHRAWYDLVARYAVRDLTYERERLTALWGTADYIMHYSQARPTLVAGLWQETLALDLLWRRVTTVPAPGHVLAPVTVPASVQHLRAIPTWSWASAGGAPVEALLGALLAERLDPDIEILASGTPLSHYELQLRQRYTVYPDTAIKVFLDAESPLLGTNEDTVWIPLVLLDETVYGILVQPTATAATKYKRVGCFQCMLYEDDGECVLSRVRTVKRILV